MSTKNLYYPQSNIAILCSCSFTKSCPILCNPWTAAVQASLSFTISLSLLKFMSIESVMLSNQLILRKIKMFPYTPALNFSQHQGLFQWVSSLHKMTKVLEFHLQHQSFQWIFKTDFLGVTGLISLVSKGLSRDFSSTTIQKHQFFGTQFPLWSNSHIYTWLLEKSKLWLNGPLLEN